MNKILGKSQKKIVIVGDEKSLCLSPHLLYCTFDWIIKSLNYPREIIHDYQTLNRKMLRIFPLSNVWHNVCVYPDRKIITTPNEDEIIFVNLDNKKILKSTNIDIIWFACSLTQNELFDIRPAMFDRRTEIWMTKLNKS